MSYFKHILQDVKVDDNNSTTTNRDSGNSYTFIGTGTSTLGVAGLQWNLKTDKDATVYIEQSDDNINWDISDEFDYFYDKGGSGGTVQAITSYWRVRVVLNDTEATTYFRLQALLCPIASPLPRSLNNYERLKTSAGIVDEETNIRARVDGIGNLQMTKTLRLIGLSFNGTTKNTNFWEETTTGSGSIIIAGEAFLETGTTADSTVKYVSVNKARKTSGSLNLFKTVARLTTSPEDDNIRRIGPYDSNDGFFFQVNGTTFGVGSKKGGSDTIVNSGSFNGNYGTNVSVNTDIYRLEIEMSELSTKFFVNGIVLHTIRAETESSTNTLNLPITMENNNINGNTNDNGYLVRFATILRIGDYLTAPTYKFINTNTTTICKYGSGILHNIINCENLGDIIIYDNTGASGTMIAEIDTGKVTGTIVFDIPFNDGLTIVTSGGAVVVVTYE